MLHRMVGPEFVDYMFTLLIYWPRASNSAERT